MVKGFFTGFILVAFYCKYRKMVINYFLEIITRLQKGICVILFFHAFLSCNLRKAWDYSLIILP